MTALKTFSGVGRANDKTGNIEVPGFSPWNLEVHASG